MAGASIGTMRERHLHASLKQWYAEPGDRAEIPVDGYVIDLVRGDLLIEIQTRGFSGMRPKLAAMLARGHRIRVVHPIARGGRAHGGEGVGAREFAMRGGGRSARWRTDRAGCARAS